MTVFEPEADATGRGEAAVEAHSASLRKDLGLSDGQEPLIAQRSS
jgi:hypothetical protein